MTGMVPVPDEISVGDVVLQRMDLSHLDALMEAIDVSYTELSRWLVPFATLPTRESEAAFLAVSRGDFDAGRSYGYLALAPDGSVAGGAGLHPQGDWVGIGYWAATPRAGRGQTTALARALTTVAFEALGVQAVQIHCDAANHASAAIPARLGYRLIDGHAREIVCAGHTGWGLTWEMPREIWRDEVSGLVIRPAGESEVRALVETFPRSQDYFSARQGDGTDLAELLTAELNEVAVGDICVRWDRPPEPALARHLAGIPYLNHLEVAEDGRRRGIGARLVLAGEARAVARGEKGIYLGVEPDKPGARRLYERLGYFEWPHGLVPTGWTYQLDGVEHEYRTELHILVKTLCRT